MFAQLFGRLFWIPTFACIAAGFWLPGDYSGLTFTVPALLGGILFFPCLKVRLGEVREHLGDAGLPRRVAGLSALKLLVFPLCVYLIMRLIAPEWAPGVALVAMMPVGLTSMAFTDLNHGNRVLALIQVLVTSLLAPLTVPLLLLLVTPVPADGLWSAMAGRAGYIITLLAIPFLAAQGLRVVAADFIDRHPAWWTRGSMFCSAVLAFAAIAVNRHAWADWPLSRMPLPLLLACIAVAVTVAGSWLVARWLRPGDAIAFACGVLYLNNGLAVAFATRFFHGQAEMVLPAALMTIPMVTAMAISGALWQRQRESALAQPAS